MTKAETVDLLNTAMRSGDAEADRKSAQANLDEAGRRKDALVAASPCALLGAGEIEALTHRRAEWLGRIDRPRPMPST